jgi:branched-chain amino acid transport system substrate-binding protein
MRRLAAIVLLLALALAPSGAPAQQQPYEIQTILTQTGPAAFIGQAQAKSLDLIEKVINKRGGVRGRPVKFVINDDQSNPQVVAQIVSRLQSLKVPVIFGPTLASLCAAAMAITAKTGPLLWCNGPGIYPPAKSFVLATGATQNDAMLVLVRYFRERGWTRLGLLVATDTSGQGYDQGVTYALARPENKDVQVVAREFMNNTDVSTSAQWAKIKAANPQAVLTLASGAPWGTMMRGYTDSGLDVPVAGGNGNLSYAQLAQYKSFLPREVFFPSMLSLVPGGVRPGPIKNAQDVYFTTFKDAGLKPDGGFNTVWDPAMILIRALNDLGPSATAEQLHDYMIGLHGYVGINGVYDYRDGLQRGVGLNSMMVSRYDNEKQEFVAVTRAAGLLK